jgi:hypothetical protein
MAKKYDLAIKTGTYKNQEGLEKGRYETLGEIHTGRDGGFFARMNAFRLLGIAMAAVARGDDSIIVSLFTPQTANQPSASTNSTQAPPAAYYDDDIPF